MASDFKSQFLRIYSNLPLNIRKEIIAMLNDEPIAWNVAYLEIKGDTKKGEEILKKLKELGIVG